MTAPTHRGSVAAARPIHIAEAAGFNVTAERARHVRFVGRTALEARLDLLLIDEPAERWIVVTGRPGWASARCWRSRWRGARQLATWPHHLLRRGQYD